MLPFTVSLVIHDLIQCT